MENENCMEIVRENSEGNRHFLGGGYVGTHWDVILKWVLLKLNGRIWAVFGWFKLSFIEGLFVTSVMNVPLSRKATIFLFRYSSTPPTPSLHTQQLATYGYT
jgi:hypothetical protein